jgi:hypothetical protein
MHLMSQRQMVQHDTYVAPIGPAVFCVLHEESTSHETRIIRYYLNVPKRVSAFHPQPSSLSICCGGFSSVLAERAVNNVQCAQAFDFQLHRSRMHYVSDIGSRMCLHPFSNIYSQRFRIESSSSREFQQPTFTLSASTTLSLAEPSHSRRSWCTLFSVTMVRAAPTSSQVTPPWTRDAETLGYPASSAISNDDKHHDSLPLHDLSSSAGTAKTPAHDKLRGLVNPILAYARL